ncbi:MAG: aminoacyl-tRNA hydrolase [Acidimicrobiales bacterium]
MRFPRLGGNRLAKVVGGYEPSDSGATSADLLAVGLGNPGPEYQGSRHNYGADAVRSLAQRHQARLKNEKGARADSTTVRIGGKTLALAVPQTFMNDSGIAVRALCRRYVAGESAKLVIVHDELDLEPGVVRIKAGGGVAGHNGLRSIEQHLHNRDFLRVRIGIGKPPGRAQGIDHVLRRPGKADRELLAVAIELAADAVEMLLADGLDAAMNRFNTRS